MPTEPGGEPPILVGVIARAHGLDGEVVVDAYSDAPERFQPGSVLTAAFPTGKTASLVVANMRPFQKRLLVQFEGVATRTEAESLRGADLLIARSEVKPLPEGQYYRFELVGLAVKSRAGEPLGEVADVFSTGSNDVYVVRGPRGEILLPAIAGVIVEIDLAQKTMTVAPPAGLPGWDGG